MGLHIICWRIFGAGCGEFTSDEAGTRADVASSGRPVSLPIRLVDDQHLEVPEDEALRVEQVVEQPAWRRYQDVDAFRQPLGIHFTQMIGV